MGRNFFSGGSMLALNSYHHLAPPSLHIADVVPVNGVGYSKTLLAWNDMLEAQKGAFVAKYGATFYNGFRAFYVVCAEAFAANNGSHPYPAPRPRYFRNWTMTETPTCAFSPPSTLSTEVSADGRTQDVAFDIGDAKSAQYLDNALI